MKVSENQLKGCFTIEPRLFEDERGYFFESFNHREFEKTIGQKVNFVQDNQSFSKKGVLRGLHFQKGEYAQAKLVSVLKGNIQDVVVDLREDSLTFGQYESIELSGSNRKQLFIPRGFAHGFVVMSETAHVFYKCDNYYNKESEGGINYKDSFLNIDWEIPFEEIQVSEKDENLPSFK